MSTRNRILIAIALFAVPIFLRFIYFYQLPFYSNAAIQRPDYTTYTIPLPPTASSGDVDIAASTENLAQGKVILIDAYHANQFEPSEVEPLITALSTRGGRVEYDKGTQTLAAQLKYASAYIVFSPSIAFSAEEIHAIRLFVESGGRLLVFTDPTRSLTTYDSLTGAPISLPDVNSSNPILAPFGLSFVNDYLYDVHENEGNFRNVMFTDFAENPLTKGLKLIVFYGVHSVQANTGIPLAWGNANTLSSLTDRSGVSSPMALSANGQVLAVGDFSFLTNPFNQVADNALLLNSIAEFALNGERIPSLANFPYLFSGPVSLVTSGEVQMTSAMLAPLASLQGALQAVNIPLSVRPAAPSQGNLIVLGTFAPSEDIVPLLRPFGVDLAASETAIEVKGFGQVSNTGSGLLLFSQGKQSNTLVILAPDADTLPTLISVVASGDLSSCIIQDSVGICSVEGGSSSGYSDYSDEFSTPLELPSGEATPEATPTPAG